MKTTYYYSKRTIQETRHWTASKDGIICFIPEASGLEGPAAEKPPIPKCLILGIFCSNSRVLGPYTSLGVAMTGPLDYDSPFSKIFGAQYILEFLLI